MITTEQDESEMHWPNNLSDAEFDVLINRLNLNTDAFVARLYDLALQAVPESEETNGESQCNNKA